MTYPIQIRHTSWSYVKGSGKEYHISLLSNSDGKGLIIRRYGKKGNAVNMITETHDNPIMAMQAFNKLTHERQKKGYSCLKDTEDTIANAAELARKIGLTVFPKLGARDVNHIDPSFDTTGMKQGGDQAQYDENGDVIKKAPAKPAFTPEQLEEARLDKERQELAAKNARYANHPLYGRF